MKRVVITIDFMVDDEQEMKCFFGDTVDDLQGQADTMTDWIREAPYNYSMTYKISDGWHGMDLLKRKYSIPQIEKLIKDKVKQAKKTWWAVGVL